MDFKQYLPEVLCSIIEKYVSINLIELAYNLLSCIPINREILNINNDGYLFNFFEQFNDALQYIENEESFIRTLTYKLIDMFMFVQINYYDKMQIYYKMEPIIKQYLNNLY